MDEWLDRIADVVTILAPILFCYEREIRHRVRRAGARARYFVIMMPAAYIGWILKHIVEPAAERINAGAAYLSAVHTTYFDGLTGSDAITLLKFVLTSSHRHGG